MRPSPLGLWAPTLAVIAAASSCATAKTLPGTTLGTYSVVGTSTGNSCGAGVGAKSPWDFDVELSKDGSTLYWSWMDGADPISGTLSSAFSTTITVNSNANADSTDAGPGPCTMQRTETLTVTLASATTPASFTGSISYTDTVATGATCTDQLTSNGGAYDILPCTVGYTLAATRK